MSKFNERFTSFMKPLLEKLSEEEVTKYHKELLKTFMRLKPKLEEMGFTNVTVSDFGAEDAELKTTVKGADMSFVYENGHFKVPLALYGYVGDFDGNPVSVAYSIDDDSFEGAETRHAAKKFLPTWLADYVTNTANDKKYSKLVQRPILRVLKSAIPDPEYTPEEHELSRIEKLSPLLDIGPTTIEEVPEKVDSIVDHIFSNLTLAAKGIAEIGKDAKDPDADKAPDDSKLKDIADMDDEEMDKYASQMAKTQDIDTPETGKMK